MRQLSPLDASFLYFEQPNAPMHIGGIAIYDPSTSPSGFVRFKDILDTISSRMHLSRAFRERLVEVPLNLDHPYWINAPDFDLEFHVRHIALPKPGDWRQLCIQAARLHARPLDRGHPLWEFYVIEGLDNVAGLPPGCFAIVSKIHHANIDGVSGAEITQTIHDLEPDAAPPPSSGSWYPEQVPSSVELLARTYGNNIVRPFRFMQVLARSVPAAARVFEGLRSDELRTVGQVPRTRFNGQVSPHRVVDGRSFALSDIRTIKSAVPGATVNDAILALVGGALRRYLDGRNELPEDPLVAMAPISVRDPSQAHSAGNQVSAMAVQLGTHIADPLERLQDVHDRAVESKALTNAVGAKLLTDYSQFIPSSVSGLAARLYTRLGLANATRPAFNCVVTNVPGPQQPLYSGGARLVTQYGLGPVLDGMGLIHPVFSYCGQITVSFTSCRDMLPDPEVYAGHLQASFDELLEAARTADAA